VRTTVIRTALASAVGTILLYSDGKRRKLFFHITTAAVLADMLLFAASRFQKLRYPTAPAAFIFEYRHFLFHYIKVPTS
jgi:hypothetical protein